MINGICKSQISGDNNLYFEDVMEYSEIPDRMIKFDNSEVGLLFGQRVNLQPFLFLK